MNKKNPWPKTKTDLTLEEAKYIRFLRIKGYTWRALSEQFCEKFYPKAYGWPKCKGNQIHGSDLCEFAAEHFGENYLKGVWNE